MHPYIAVITVLTVLLLLATATLVGRARGRYDIKAPATTGHEQFDRAFRVQMNTQESALMFLPALWTAATFGAVWLSAALGALWLLGRIWYAFAYVASPAKRGPGFLISMIALFVLLGQAIWGIVWTLALS